MEKILIDILKIKQYNYYQNKTMINLTPPDNQPNNSSKISLVPPSELGGTSSILSSSLESFEDPTQLGFQPKTGIDNIDLRARSQSTADKWGNGAVKMLGTAATSFAEPFVDLTVGVAQAIGTGKISGIYDNVVTQQFDGFNEYLQKEFPNYYTKAEEEAGVLEGLGTANFWADKALNGAGYMLGAIGSGMLTGGLGLGTRATGATKILQGLGKEFSAGKKVLDLANLTAKEARLIKAGRALDNLTASTVGAIGESGMEARGIKNNTLKTLTQLRDSGDPRYVGISDEDINSAAEAAGNTGFALNMAIVGTSNFLQFGKLFKNGYSAERQAFGEIAKDAESGLFKAVKPSKLSRVGRALTGPLEEMAQEGGQYTVEKGVDDYIKNKYNPKQGVVFSDLVSSTLQGLEETLTTKEGQESMLLGALLGGVGSITNIGESAQKQKATEQAANILNAYKSSDAIKPLINSIIAHGSYQAAMDDAIKKGDHFNYKNAQFGQFFTYVQSRIVTDKYDLLQNELEEAGSLNKEDFEKAFGIKVPEGKSPMSVVSELKQSAEKIKKISEDVNTRFSTIDPKVKDVLTRTIAVTENLNKRELQLANEVLSASGINYLDLKNAKDPELRKEYKKILNQQIKDLQENNPMVYDSVIDKLKDLDKINLSQEQLIKDYKELVTEEGQNRIKKKVEKAEAAVDQAIANEVNKDKAQPVTPPAQPVATEETPEEFDSSQETFGQQVDIESLSDEERAAYGLPPKGVVVQETPKGTLSEELAAQREKELDSLENAFENEQISEEEYIKRSKEIDDRYDSILAEADAKQAQEQAGTVADDVKKEQKDATTIIPNKEEFNRTKFFTKFEAKEQEEADKVLAEVSQEELTNNLSIEITPNPFLDKSKPIDKGNGVFYNAPKFTVKVYYKGTFLGHLPNPNMYTDANGNVISSTELDKLNGNLSKAELDYLAAQQEALQAFYTFVEQNNVTEVDAQLLKDLNVSISKTTGSLAVVPKDQVQETTLDNLKVDYLDVTNGQFIIIDRSDVYEGGKVLGSITPAMYKELGITDVYEMLAGVPENFPRYVVAIPNANGTITYVPVRPKEITKEDKSDIFNDILTAAKEFKANKPSESVTHNFEKSLDQRVFIALPNAETHISVSIKGDPYVKIKLDGAKKAVKVFVPTGVAIGETFDDFINNIQKAIDTESKYASLKKAGVNLKPESIKFSIPKEPKTTDKAFSTKFLTATTPVPTVGRKLLISFDKQVLEDNTVPSTTEATAISTVSDIKERRQKAIDQATTQNSHWSTPLITTDKYVNEFNKTPTRVTWWNKQDMIDDINSGKYDTELTALKSKTTETTPIVTPVSDIEAAYSYITTRKYNGNRKDEVNKVGEDLAKRFVVTLKEKGLVKEGFRTAERTDGSVEKVKVNTDTEGNNLGNDWSTAGKFKEEFRKFVDAELTALNQPIETVDPRIVKIEERRKEARGKALEEIGVDERNLDGSKFEPHTKAKEYSFDRAITLVENQFKANPLSKIGSIPMDAANAIKAELHIAGIKATDKTALSEINDKLKEINTKYNEELAALESKPTTTSVSNIDPLKDVESTTNAIKNISQNVIYFIYTYIDAKGNPQNIILNKGTTESNNGFIIDETTFISFSSISEAYHKAKIDGNNPKLVQAVEDLLSKPTEEVITPKVEPVVTIPQAELTAGEKFELDNLQTKIKSNIFTEEEFLRYGDLYDRNQRNQKVDPGTTLFSIGTTTETGNLNIEKAKEWVKSVLPETIAVEELNGLFDNIVKHGTTFGAFMDNVIYLSKNAPLGTEYHEAFHAVFRLLSTESEIKTYLNIAKRERGKVSAKELNEFRNAATNRANLTTQELEDLYYEEYLAEKFKNWMKSKTSGSLLNKLFKKIANWIKGILGRKTELDTLFADIATGKFRTAVPVTNRFTNRNMGPAFALVPNGIVEENGVKDYTYANPEFTRVLINTIGAKVFKIYTSKDNTLTKEQIVDKLIKEEAAKYDVKALLPRLATVPVNQKGNIVQQAFKRKYMLTEVIPSTIIKEQVNKAIKLFDFKEDTDDNTYDGSEGKTERFDVEAWSIGGFGSVNSIAKQYLGFTTYMAVNEVTGLEEEVAVDSNKLYNGVLRALASTNEKNMLNRLSQYSQDVPNAKALFQRMVNDFGIVEDQKGNLIPTKRVSEYKSVINAFKKEKVDYIAIVVDPETRQIKIYPANQRDTKKIQVEQWGTKYLTLSRLEDAKKTMDKALFNAFQVFDNTAPRTASELDNDALVLQKELEKIGVKLSIGVLRYSINSSTFNGTDVLGSNLTPEQLKNYNTFSDIVPLTKQDIEAIRNIIAKGNSPFESLTEEDTAAIGRLEKIAESNAIFDETVGTSNFQNAEGKQVFQIINSSLALEVTRELNNPEYRKLLMDNFFMSENLLLNHPLADEIFSGLRVALLDGIRETSITVQGEEGFNKKAGTTFGSYDGRSYLLTSHGLFLEQFNAQNSIKVDGKIVGKTALYNIAQNEASNTAYLVKLPVEEYYTTQGITDKALQDLTSLVGQEFNRINKRNQEIAEGVNPIKDIHDGKLRGLKFWNFAWLETASPNLNAFLIKEAKEGVPFAETLKKEVGGKNIQNVLNALLKDHFNKEIAKHKEILKEEGILTPTMNLFPGTKTDKTGIFNEKYDGNIDHYLGDFLLNDYINSTSFNQFIDGDPSTRKNAIDYVKRNKSRMASGPNMGEGNHTVAYIKDIEKPIYTDTLDNVPQSKLDELKELAKSTGRDYKELLAENNIANINTADAQSYISLNHRVNQLKAWGKYSPAVEAIYNKLIAGEKLSWEDTQTLIKNDAGLNSVKSVTAGFTINDNEVENFDTEVYHKLSEFTLTRGITSYKDKDGNWKAIKGREYWHNLLDEMDKHSIDQVIYESGSKLATTNPVSAVDGKYDLTNSFVKVPNKYKRLQVETPSNKLKITAGTQLLQLIDSEQTDNTEVEYLGKKTTIGELRKEYQKLLALTRGNSVRNVMNTLFKENGDPDLRKAAERFLDTLEASGADISLLEFFSTKANGDPKYNWNLPSVIDKFEQLFLSQFGSGVLAQKVPGFKLSLVSGAGFNIIREKATGKIIRTDEYLESEDKAKYDTDAYETTELKHNVVDPKTGKLYSEVVVPAHFQLMYDLKPGDEVPSDLFSMLGYRIPTQEKHSMMSIRVVDILPAEYGSIVIAPKEIVYLSGADFDIDSLFVQRPDFYINKNGEPVVFGTAKTDVEKFNEYIEYQNAYNKDFSSLVKTEGIEKAPSILKQLGLPSNYKELAAKNKAYGEQNNSVNNNNILAIQIEMLTNKAISEKIAKTPATMTALANEADFINALQKVTEESTSDVHSINGKYEAHKNNSTGKSNIGPAANGNLINALLTKENVKLEDGIFAFKIDDKEYNTFGNTLDGTGNRKNDTLSTVLSAMTDNAKERLAARLNLSLDMLNTVIYMISLGTPLKQVMLFVNQPIIKEYAALRNTSNYTIKTNQDPQNQFVVDSMIEEKYKLPPVTLFKANSEGFTTDELTENIKQNKSDKEVLGQFLQLQKQASYYFKIANIIKINKGLGTSFDDLNKIVESIKELGVEGILDSTENLDNIKTWSSLLKGVPFDIREAVLKTQSKENLEYLNSILKASEKLVLTQSNTFKRIYSVAKRVLKTRLSGRAQVELDMKRDLLGFLSIKAYKQLLSKSSNPEDIKRLNSLSDTLLYPELGGKTLADQLIEIKNSENKEIATNPLVEYLTPLFKYSAPNIPNRNNKYGLDVVTGRQRIRENTQYIEELIDGYKALYANKETRDFAINLFNYLLIKDGARFRDKSFVKYLAPFVFTQVSKGLDIVVEDFAKGTSDTINSLGIDAGKAMTEFIEIYARYKFNEKNITKVQYFLDAPTTEVSPEDPNSITYNFFKGYDKNKSLDENKERMSFNNAFLERFFNPVLTKDNKINFEFPLFVKINGQVYKLVSLNNKPGLLTSETTIPQGTSAKYTLVTTMGRKGELPYSRTVEESEKLNQAILKNEVAPVITVEKEEEEDYYKGYEENIPAELNDNFDENYEEEEYYDDSNIESAEEAFDRSEGGYELQWPTQIKTGVQELFDSNTKLADIGTPEQYSEYLDTIFPNSKVKDIVYHGTNSDVFEKFNTTREKPKRDIVPSDGIFFSYDKEASSDNGFGASHWGKNIIASVVDVQNPEVSTMYNTFRGVRENKTSDSILGTTIGEESPSIDSALKKWNTTTEKIKSEVLNKGQKNSWVRTVVVFDQNQGHVLGSNEDLQGFKKFVTSTQPQAVVSDNTPTPIEGLNERLDSYGNAKLVLSPDFFQGKRPEGKLNGFKALLSQVRDNLVVLADVNWNNFDFFLSKEDIEKLNSLKPMAEELDTINTLKISKRDTRTIAIEKRYAQLSNQLVNDFVGILGKAVKEQLGKSITSSKPSLISTEQPQAATTEVQGNTLVQKAKGLMNTLFATKEKITTFAITESELAVINENVKKAGFPGSYTMEKFNSLTKEQQEIVKKCYGR